MLKLAAPIGIAAEWVLGPPAHSLLALAQAGPRALLFAALAWLILETIAAAWRAVDALES